MPKNFLLPPLSLTALVRLQLLKSTVQISASLLNPHSLSLENRLRGLPFEAFISFLHKITGVEIISYDLNSRKASQRVEFRQRIELDAEQL